MAIATAISKLSKVEFARSPFPALLKEPANFWDEIFIANEAYILEEITHPRIRQKLAYDATSHQLFLEYVEGTTLQDLVKSGETLKDPARTHHLLQSVAETVADMHAGILCDRPIVHNDLKSMNVLVPDDAPREIILIDFSHSYFEHHLPPFILDKKQNPVGTARYLAPEKWDGDFTHGLKSDVFAFGVMAYYAYTGRHPFEGELAEIEQQIREATPPSPIELGVNVLRNTLATMMSCLAKKPAQRPSMEHVAKSYADAASLYE
ncbi:MAG: protein kinase [Verrucomicrobiales bacterium]|nr:protein kinase [Verrucomicrobiales bacterium]